MRAYLVPALVLASVVSSPVLADNLPSNTVGCISLKDAIKYAEFTKTAPDFAADMIDRATCYLNKEEVEAVKLNQSKGYTRYQLLSGHKVWVPTRKVR